MPRWAQCGESQAPAGRWWVGLRCQPAPPPPVAATECEGPGVNRRDLSPHAPTYHLRPLAKGTRAGRASVSPWIHGGAGLQ